MANQIYLFYGEERFLIQEKIRSLKAKISDADFNLEQIDGSNPENLNQVINALQAQSLLSGNQLVIVRDLDLKDKTWEKACPALAAVSPGTTVVFWAAAMDKRSKFFKSVDKLGEVMEFKSFTDWDQPQVISWIEKTVKARGKTIEHEAAVLLREICGNNLAKLDTEIEKLITYIAGRQAIGRDDVEKLASPGEVSVFALSNAVAAKNLRPAMAAWQSLLRNKVEPSRLIGLLASQIKKSPRFSQTELAGALELLLNAEIKLKTGEQPAALMELLLTDLCLAGRRHG